MTPLELLQSYKTRLGDALFGADYESPPKQSFNKIRQEPKTPTDIRIKQSVGGQFTVKGSGKFKMPMFHDTPRVPGSKVQPLINTNPPGLKLKPLYPGSAGSLGGLKGGAVKGGLVVGAAEVAGQLVIPHIAREAVRGAQVVTGQDTTNFDNKNAGRPVVKNVNGVSYNIATPGGLAGYQKAMKAGGKDSTPGKDTRTGNVDTPTDYPTEAVTKTIKPSRDYEKEASERTSSAGVVQKGLTLGGVNKILKGFGAGELADVSTTYQSEALPATLAGVTQLEKPLVEGANPTQKPDVSQPFQQDPQLQASFPEGTKPFASTDKYTPYSTGGNPEDPQDGISSEPDRVERIRQVAFQPKGARQKEVASRKSVRGNFGGDEPDNSTLVSPTQSNPMRNQIRDIYGDTSLSIAQQSAKVSALTGVYRYGGEGYANVDGELVPSKVGAGRSLLNARGAGLDPSEFLQQKVAEVKETAKTDLETPVETEAPSTSSTMTPGLTLEEGNIEYGAMKFVRDPKTNSMVPAK